MSEFNCKACEDSGWVCERHPERKWENADGSTCCTGAGGNCPCNPDGEVHFEHVFASTRPGDAITQIH